MVGIVGAMGLVVGAAGPLLDVSSLVPSAQPVARTGEGACVDREDGVLGMAVVVYGRRSGRSRWGHISLRFLACEGGRLRDVEFESTRADRTTRAWFADMHPDEDWHSAEDFDRLQRDRLVLFRNEDPVDAGSYYAQLVRNREIVELWLPWQGPQATAVLMNLDAQYDSQLDAFRAGEEAPGERYRALAINCTHPVREAAGALGGVGELDSIFPFRWRHVLAGRGDVTVVVHPSADVLSRIEQSHGDLKAAWSGAPVGLPSHFVHRRMPTERMDAFRARILDDASSVGVKLVLDMPLR